MQRLEVRRSVIELTDSQEQHRIGNHQPSSPGQRIPLEISAPVLEFSRLNLAQGGLASVRRGWTCLARGFVFALV